MSWSSATNASQGEAVDKKKNEDSTHKSYLQAFVCVQSEPPENPWPLI